MADRIPRLMTTLFQILAQAAPAAPAGGGEQPGGGMGTMILFFGITLAIMYFLMIRPQKRKENELREMVNRLKKNDKVVLQGGIFGVVASVHDKFLMIKIDEKQDVRVRVLKSAVIGIEGKKGEMADAASAPAEETKEEKETEKLEDKKDK